jgi:hypothetical protein
VEFLRPHHQVDMGDVAHQLRPPALRHATEEAENEPRLVLAQIAEHPHFADRLLLGHVAHAAGVQQHHIRVPLMRCQLIAARQEHLRDLFGIAFVHLAAIGFDEGFGHGQRAR